MVRSRAAAAAAVAYAVPVKKGPITVTFNGTISPRKLPRTGTAAVSVQMGGKISSTDNQDPPILNRIVLDINRHGVLQPDGLPRCPLHKLKSISTAGARRVCGEALVGKGSVTSRVSLPGQNPFASIGQLLAFNGRYKGHPAILAHVSSEGSTLPLTYVIVFEVKKGKGEFGTSLIGDLPPIASSYGYITAFNLSLRRTYHSHGRRLSYASAGCPAPKGFTEVNFTMAKVSYIFENGPTVSGKVEQKCKVRR